MRDGGGSHITNHISLISYSYIWYYLLQLKTLNPERFKEIVAYHAMAISPESVYNGCQKQKGLTIDQDNIKIPSCI